MGGLSLSLEEFQGVTSEAFLKAALEMGNDLKTLSWFGRYRRRLEAASASRDKLAA
jgi:hypothetical protein